MADCGEAVRVTPLYFGFIAVAMPYFRLVSSCKVKCSRQSTSVAGQPQASKVANGNARVSSKAFSNRTCLCFSFSLGICGSIDPGIYIS